MANNNGGPWGGGGGNRGGDDDGRDNRGGGGRRPNDPQIPDIDQIVKKGQEQLRVLMGGNGGNNTGSTGGGEGPRFTRGTLGIGAAVVVGLWLFASFYTVKPEQQSVELLLGKFYTVGNPGLNFAPWPLVTKELVDVTQERMDDIGVATSRGGAEGLMLTTDENIVDIDFQVVWNINDPFKFLYSLRDPQTAVQAVAESAMREVISARELAPILNLDRGVIADQVEMLIQTTMDSYDSGVNIVRVNLNKADPPEKVIDAFREVQAAEQQRDRLERQADKYSNEALAEARGKAAQTLEKAEGYRAAVVNEAEGEASRFLAVLDEYRQAPDVTRQRIYLETMEQVLGRVDKVIIDQSEGSQGVVPYLPLNELNRSSSSTGGGNN